MYTYKHVILVGIDGAGNFYRNTAAPTIRRVMAAGAGTDMCLTAVPTDSAQCWGSMLMGVTCKIHGLHNDKLSAATSTLATEEHPTIYRMIRRARPNARMGCFSNWSPIITGLLDDGQTVTATCDDGPLCDRICDYVKSETLPSLSTSTTCAVQKNEPMQSRSSPSPNENPSSGFIHSKNIPTTAITAAITTLSPVFFLKNT